MTKTDILINKDQEIKRLNDQIRNLEEKITNLTISLGSKDEVLKSTIKELERELELARDQQKVIIQQAETKNNKYKCSICSYITDNLTSCCPMCGNYSIKKYNYPQTSITYKNLDTELAEIKKSVEKQMKKSVADLEEKQLDLEIQIEQLENENKRKDKRHNREIDDLQSKNLDRINDYKEQIQELKDEIVKVKKGKTEAELEAKRKEEVEKLKAANNKLLEKLAESEKVGFWRRLWRSITDYNIRKAAVKEILEEAELSKKIENDRYYINKRKGYRYVSSDYTNTEYIW